MKDGDERNSPTLFEFSNVPQLGTGLMLILYLANKVSWKLMILDKWHWHGRGEIREHRKHHR